tara:strand:- start:447 stop:608 length:162 start_codon:yes stop_codon:yes gene_type:complete
MEWVCCQIASGKIPAHVVHEDEHVLALIDNGRNALGESRSKVERIIIPGAKIS